MHSFTFDGINSRDYCELFVSGGGTFNAPERDIESVSVPGRNGDLTLDNGRYKNIKIEYNAWIAKDFPENAAKARAWLCRGVGYKRLEDDYNPFEFRMARFVEGLNFDVFASFGDQISGSATLAFDAMPQRFLKSGEDPITYSNVNLACKLINPTSEDSLPLIEIYNGGTTFPEFYLYVNGGRIPRTIHYVPDPTYTYADKYKYLLFDCDKQVMYHKERQDYGWSSSTSGVSISGDFPIFYGEKEMEVNTSLPYNADGYIKIVPRWWTI